MQQIIIIIALLFSSVLMAQTQENIKKLEGKTITVTVTNALSDDGSLSFALFNKEGFRKEALQAKVSTIENGVGSVKFESVAEGEYAVICFHDSNSNNKMDFHENGMPKESYGTSNNVYLMGPPQFENSKFKVSNEDLKLEIKF